MRIEGRRFLELALHVKLASEAMMEAARHLATLRPQAIASTEVEAWTRTVDELIAMNAQIGLMERVLRAATRETEGGGRKVRSQAH
jgi:hypothetical protein